MFNDKDKKEEHYPNCPYCRCKEFIESGIVYEPAGKGSCDDMRVIICKECKAIIGIPTRGLFDCFFQLGAALTEIMNQISHLKTQ